MLGYELHEVLGRNMHDLTHHTHPDGAHYPVEHCPIFHAFRAGVACRIDSDVLWRKDGTAFPVEYTSYPILDGGQVLGAVVTFVDVPGFLPGIEQERGGIIRHGITGFPFLHHLID